MRLFNKLFGWLFGNKRNYVCGGVGYIEVTDRLGRVVSGLYFNRPDSDMRLNYSYEYQDISSKDVQLKEIKEDKEKGGNTAKKIHEILERDLFIPEAEKIFSHCEGYLDGGRKIIDNLSKEKQFDFLKKYFRHHLVQMVTLAYDDASTFKKKF